MNTCGHGRSGALGAFADEPVSSAAVALFPRGFD